MKNHTLLYAEDDRDFAELNIPLFEADGFRVLYADNGTDAYRLYKGNDPDILLFDVIMPDLSGLELTKKIRKIDSKTPILLLTALSEAKDAIKGFDAGVNDYVRKDCKIEELLVRLKYHLKPYKDDIICISDTTSLDKQQHLLFVKEGPIQLTLNEYNVLQFLLKNKNKILPRKFLIEEIWGQENPFAYDYLNKAITFLRRYFQEDDQLDLLSLRNRGLKLKTPY